MGSLLIRIFRPGFFIILSAGISIKSLTCTGTYQSRRRSCLPVSLRRSGAAPLSAPVSFQNLCSLLKELSLIGPCKHQACHKGAALAPDGQDAHIGMYFPAFSHAVALPAFRGRHPVPFLVAHLRINNRLLLDTVDAGAMGVMEVVSQIPYPIKPVIGACAAVSYMKQEIPVFFRQPYSLLLLKFLYHLLTGRR